MNLYVVRVLTTIGICTATSLAQSIAIDMDTASDIQKSYVTMDTAQKVSVAVRLTDATDLFSYQCKVAFDTTRFSFIGAQPDFGITGEKNILTKTGGAIIGICQLQVNPEAADTVEFSYSITGTDDTKSVSGDGLIGVLYLKSRITTTDSSTISVSQGVCATYSGKLLTVKTHQEGVYNVRPVSRLYRYHGVRSHHNAMETPLVVFSGANKPVTFVVPERTLKNLKDITVQRFSINGKLMAEYHAQLTVGQKSVYLLQTSGCRLYTGSTSIYRLNAGNTRLTHMVSTP